MDKRTSQNLRQATLNTLAQNGTVDNSKPVVILRGKGSEISRNNFGLKKGKQKTISQKMALHLVDIAKEKGKDVKPFWNTYNCMSKIVSHNGKVYGNYCKNRFCTVCTAIRKAEKINSYYPELKKWEQPYFVTLTVKACKAERLKIMMKACIRAITRIIAKYRKRKLRNGGIAFVGIRSLECNFNPVKNTYNPHFHIVVMTEEMATTLVAEWLKIWTSKFTSAKAQHLQKVWDLESALIETIKYGSKIFTEIRENDGKNIKVCTQIYTKAYFNILDAMHGLRIFERFGFNLPKHTKVVNPAFVTSNFNEWIFLPNYHDWHHTENELTLTGYEIEDELISLLNNFNTVKE